MLACLITANLFICREKLHIYNTNLVILKTKNKAMKTKTSTATKPNKLEEFYKKDNGSFKPIFDEMQNAWTYLQLSSGREVPQGEIDDFYVFCDAVNTLLGETYEARFEGATDAVNDAVNEAVNEAVKVGDKVRITDNLYGHGFEIGDEVMLVCGPRGTGMFFAKKHNTTWGVFPDEFEEI